MVNELQLDNLILQALEEDIGKGDITTAVSLGDSEPEMTGSFIAKEDFVLAGIDVAERVFLLTDELCFFEKSCRDGEVVSKGTVFAKVNGNGASLLTAERTALNFLGRMCGIATASRKCSDVLKPYKAQILDTRKTSPLLRPFEKYAVAVGGGKNHRFGLYDGILIKDNHIAAAGGISEVLEKARRKAPHGMKIEIEVEDLDQLKEAIAGKADIVLLDNMDSPTMKKAVEMCNGKVITEASGGITFERLREVAETGVDFISAGFLTHTVKCADISLKLEYC